MFASTTAKCPRDRPSSASLYTLRVKPWALYCLVAGAIALSGCSSQIPRPDDPFAGYRLVDLTHPFDQNTVFWPTGKPFRHEQTAWGAQPDGYFYSAYDLAMSEHCGTHLDAPIHFAEGGEAVGDIALDDLAGPVAVVDIREQCEANQNYVATAADLTAFEAAHGTLEEGSIVLFRTGWSKRWPDTLRYLGDDTPGKADALQFPGISTEAARWLAAKGVSAVGIDTASIDPGSSTTFPAHQILAADSVSILENVANLEELPETGAFLLAFPMKIGAGSGAPCRIAALVPNSS